MIFSEKINRIGGNLAWLVGDRLFRMAIGVVVLGFVARYLGTASFGDLNYAIGLTAIFSSLATLGIEGIVIRELVRTPQNTELILGTACALRLVGGTLSVGLLYLAALGASHATVVAPLILVVSLAFLPQALEVIDLWFQKNIRSKFTVVAKGMAVLLGAAVKITLVQIKAPLL